MPEPATLTLGAEFAHALAAKDFAPRILDLMHPEIDFRGLTPNRYWEASDAETAISGVLEQQAYLSERDGRIGWMRVACSGFRPVAAGD